MDVASKKLLSFAILAMMLSRTSLNAFSFQPASRLIQSCCTLHHPTVPFPSRTAVSAAAHPSESSKATVRVGDLLSDLPTPSLLLELSLVESSLDGSGFSLGDVLKDPSLLQQNGVSLEGSLFVHTKVTDTSLRDRITKEQGSGKSQVICQVDASLESIPGGAFLGIGLANHQVGGYYWARGMGMGASLPAHGIFFRALDSSSSGGELYWKKRGPGMNAFEKTEESSNSNDGKRSEWADFVVVGDTVQLVPESAAEILTNNNHADCCFSILFGVRRIGRPLGADPIVEKIWIRSSPSSHSDELSPHVVACDGWMPLS